MRKATTVLAAASCIAASPVPFRYIVVRGNSLRSVNGLPVEVRAPPAFHVLAPTSRHATFDSHPYEVSLAAFASKDTAVMFHCRHSLVSVMQLPPVQKTCLLRFAKRSSLVREDLHAMATRPA